MRQIDNYFDNIPHGLQSNQLTTTRYKRGAISILERILRDKAVRDDDYKGRRNNHIRSLELQSEQPLLLHPVLDNPEDYLFFKMDGTVTAKNSNIRGLKTIEYYGLSDWKNREILIQERLKIIKNVRRKVYHAVDAYVNDERLYQDLYNIHLDLIEKIQTKEPFSAVRRSCLVNFKSFFIYEFKDEQEVNLNHAYARLKKEF